MSHPTKYTQETKLIDLSEHDPTNIARMLQWIYLEKYDMDNTEWFNHDGITTAIHLPMFEHQAAWEQLLWEDRGRAIMEIHADVYIFADKLGIKGLKSLALVYVDEAHSLRLDPGQFVYYFECFPRSLTEDPLLLSHLVELAIKCFPVEDGKLTDPYMMRLLDRNNKFVHLLCATLVSRLRASATS